MKKLAVVAAMLLAAAGYVFLQTTAPAPKLATLMPGGALLYLEAGDFNRLLRDWSASQVKADWLESANYAVFSNSNLFSKLGEVYQQYGAAAGLLPDLGNIGEIAGADSALALYGIRDVEFLYISRIADSALMKSQLWALRDKFEARQAAGMPFYLHTDPASKRTVAFAFAKGYLFVATRDDLVAQSLDLLAGGSNPSIASDSWYRDSTAAASLSGELRLVMNLETLVKSDYFRSYWIQRNVSAVRAYSAGLADVSRTAREITEHRVFLRTNGAAEPEPATSSSVTSLLSLVPPDAGLYKASLIAEPGDAAALIVQKLIGTPPQHTDDWRTAPLAVSADIHAGNESDLETRIDEQPLPSGSGESDAITAVQQMLATSGTRALLLVQSSALAGGTFVRTPSVIVVDGAKNWDVNSVQTSLAAAAGKLWTTSELGAHWATGAAGRHPIQQLDGMGKLFFASRERLLFLSNDIGLLTAVLNRAGANPGNGGLTYAAGFRHLRERSNYLRAMTALDFGPSTSLEQGVGTRAFFSENLASLSAVLSKVAEIRVAEEHRGRITAQTVSYQLTP